MVAGRGGDVEEKGGKMERWKGEAGMTNQVMTGDERDKVPEWGLALIASPANRDSFFGLAELKAPFDLFIYIYL
jgi:hypothetical protein